MRSITFLLLFTTAVGICIGLSCPPKCKRKWCIQYVESKLECPGNLVKDACGCCYVCAKQINESCGGIWHAHGTCDVGLECNYSYHIPADHPATYPGVCKKKLKCQVDEGPNEWIDVGQNITVDNCSQICTCKEDGTLDCRKHKGTCDCKKPESTCSSKSDTSNYNFTEGEVPVTIEP